MIIKTIHKTQTNTQQNKVMSTATPAQPQLPKVKKIVKIKKTKPKSISPPPILQPNEEIEIVFDDEILTLTPASASAPTKTKTKEEEENEFVNNLNELQKKAHNIAKCHLGSSFNLAKSNIYHCKN